MSLQTNICLFRIVNSCVNSTGQSFIEFRSMSAKHFSPLIFVSLAFCVIAQQQAEEAVPLVCSAQNVVDTPLVQWEFKKINGALFLRMKIKDVDEFKKVAGDTCIGSQGQPLTWHIHTKAAFPDELGVGPEVCAPANTGGHLDPGLACGPSTGNTLCKSLKVPGSSALPNNVGGYMCTPEVYAEKSAYACEAGDLSGKYGELVVPPVKHNTMTFTIFAEDLHDGLNPCELAGTSIVVHCGTTPTRAVCMKLDVKVETHDLFFITLRKYNEELIEYADVLTDSL